jgi:hypothetical protein
MGKRSFLAQSEYRIKVQKLSPNKTDIDSVVERLVVLKGGAFDRGDNDAGIRLFITAGTI